MSKRDYFQLFAKEDIKRFKNNENCLLVDILNREELDDCHRLMKRQKSTHIKTAIAWSRRAGALKLALLHKITQSLIENKDNMTNNEDSVDAQNNETCSEISQHSEPENSILNAEFDQSTVTSPSEVSSVANSKVGRSEVSSVANSKVGRSEVGSVANSKVGRSEVGSSEVSSVVNSKVGRSEVGSVTNNTRKDAEYNTIDCNSEETINTWYHTKLTELENLHFRNEQFRRKRAELRVQYWTHLDKFRNNATPTVINGN